MFRGPSILDHLHLFLPSVPIFLEGKGVLKLLAPKTQHLYGFQLIADRSDRAPVCRLAMRKITITEQVFQRVSLHCIARSDSGAGMTGIIHRSEKGSPSTRKWNSQD